MVGKDTKSPCIFNSPSKLNQSTSPTKSNPPKNMQVTMIYKTPENSSPGGSQLPKLKIKIVVQIDPTSNDIVGFNWTYNERCGYLAVPESKNTSKSETESLVLVAPSPEPVPKIGKSQLPPIPNTPEEKLDKDIKIEDSQMQPTQPDESDEEEIPCSQREKMEVVNNLVKSVEQPAEQPVQQYEKETKNNEDAEESSEASSEETEEEKKFNSQELISPIEGLGVYFKKRVTFSYDKKDNESSDDVNLLLNIGGHIDNHLKEFPGWLEKTKHEKFEFRGTKRAFNRGWEDEWDYRASKKNKNTVIEKLIPPSVELYYDPKTGLKKFPTTHKSTYIFSEPV